MERQETDRVLPLPPPPGNKWRTIAAVLFVLGIVLGAIISYGGNAEQISSLQTQITDLQYDNAQLQYRITQLETSYNSLKAQYQQLQEKYKFSPTIPYTLICNGTIRWFFKDMKGDILNWYMPLDTYRVYVNKPKSTDTVRLVFEDGSAVNMLDIRGYIQPQFFSKVILGIAEGRTDKEFVLEVDNVKNQIVVYGSGLGDYYRWPAETLTEGRGMCGDTTILMASMIIEGNYLMDYGMTIYIEYVDADHISDPIKINHAVIKVEFKDGDKWIIETTTNYFYNHLEHHSVYGWSFDVTTQGIGS